MVETPVELVDGSGQGIVAIDEIAVDDGPDGLFAPVADLPNAVCTGPLLVNLVFLIVEPLQGFQRLVDLGPSPSPRGSTAMVSGVKWCMRQYRLQALAMVMHLAMGLKPACRSNSC